MEYAYEDADYPDGQPQEEEAMEVDDGAVGREEMDVDEIPVTQEDAWAVIRCVTPAIQKKIDRGRNRCINSLTL
jgi:hypothetical protein